MDTGLLELVVFGSVVVLIGILVIISLVRELAPGQRRNWLLGIGLGAGVLAFSLKIAFIVIFDGYSDSILVSMPRGDDYRKTAPTEIDLPHFASQQTASKSSNYVWESLPESAPFPENNPPTTAKIHLGKKLFFDKRLSADNSVSCASCHDLSVEKGGADGLPVSIGIHKQQGTRNAPSVLNTAFQRVLFWDGRAASLEEQAKGPLVNPLEMGMPSLISVEQRVQSIPEYKEEFAQVFGIESAISIDMIAKAIATYERTLITPDSPYDRFIKGDSEALTEQQLHGMALFESTGCVQCHSGPNFSGASILSDDVAYRIFPVFSDKEYVKRYNLTEDMGKETGHQISDRGIWRIPSLRNVSRTAPYFHNGSVDSLEEAVRIMASMQLNKTLSNDNKDDKTIRWLGRDRQLRVLENQALNDTEVKAIVAFLEALSGDLLMVQDLKISNVRNMEGQ